MLFIDIVAYSKLLVHEWAEALHELNAEIIPAPASKWRARLRGDSDK